jgi:biotin operon repressor
MTRRAAGPLFVSEQELARRLLGERAAVWAGVVQVLERDGFPKQDPLMGGRYYPAVLAFLDRRAGLDKPITLSEQDKEDWS